MSGFSRKILTTGVLQHEHWINSTRFKKETDAEFLHCLSGYTLQNELYATGTTGRLIEEVTNLNVHKYLAGHLGGAQQLGAQIEHNEIDLVIFFVIR